MPGSWKTTGSARAPALRPPGHRWRCGAAFPEAGSGGSALEGGPEGECCGLHRPGVFECSCRATVSVLELPSLRLPKVRS